MANYNNEKYIAEAIESVLTQTSPMWELIIVDDCSADNSYKIAEQYTKNKQIKLVKNNQNIGYTRTLKKLIDLASYDIVGILDSDDVLAKNAVADILHAYKNNSDCGFIYSQFVYCNSDLKITQNGFCDFIPKGSSALCYDVVSHFKTFKKSEYYKTEGYDSGIVYGQDKDLVFKMEEVTKIFFLNKRLYFYRVLPNSQSHEKEKRLLGKIFVAESKYKAFKRRQKNSCCKNLSKEEMGDILISYLRDCLRLKKYKLFTFFFIRAVMLNPEKISKKIFVKSFLIIKRVIFPKILSNLYKKLKNFYNFNKKYQLFIKNIDQRFLVEKSAKPILNEATSEQYFDRHYVYHTAWASGVLKKTKPKIHYDISSYIYFATITSSFIPIRYYDYRPVKLDLPDIKSFHADLCSLPFKDESIQSLSCMHTVEHIGLGRYGDNLDVKGDIKAVNELKRVLKKEGNLLFVVPVGIPKIIFNLHRIYSYQQVMNFFKDFRLKEFVLIPDKSYVEKNNAKDMIFNPNPNIVKKQQYACGCFWFKK